MISAEISSGIPVLEDVACRAATDAIRMRAAYLRRRYRMERNAALYEGDACAWTMIYTYWLNQKKKDLINDWSDLRLQHGQGWFLSCF